MDDLINSNTGSFMMGKDESLKIETINNINGSFTMGTINGQGVSNAEQFGDESFKMGEIVIFYTDNINHNANTIRNANIQSNIKPNNILQYELPKVTIIVPMYNVEKYIESCILSLINQTYKNIEIYLINDCSTDNTKKIAKKLINIYPDKIKFIDNLENTGTYVSINTGIVNSTGEYITIIGADDKFTKNKVERQVNVLNNKNMVACYCYYERRDHKTNEKLSVRFGESTIMFKRTILRKIGYYDSVRFGGDSEFMERINSVYGNHRTVILNSIMYLAISRPESLTVSSGKSNINSSTRTIYRKNYLKWHNSNNNLYIDFPLKQRPFWIPKEMV